MANANSGKAKLQISQAQRNILLAVRGLPAEVSVALQRSTNTKLITLELCNGTIAALHQKVSENLNDLKGNQKRSLAAILRKLDFLLSNSSSATESSPSPSQQKAWQLPGLSVDASAISDNTYLSRRIKHLVQLVNEGRFFGADTLEEEIRLELQRDLETIRVVDGSLDLSTCSPLVRSIARSVYKFSEFENPNSNAERPAKLEYSSADIMARQKKYLNVLAEALEVLLGCPHTRYESLDAFHEGLKRNMLKIGSKVDDAFNMLANEVREMYGTHHSPIYTTGRELGGVKMVVGGSSNFSESHLAGVRKMLLYADTVFIPDPILPWLERDRPLESFKTVQIVHAAFTLLQLAPMFDSELAIPPVMLFPSWEKSLESEDEQTKDGLSRLSLDFYSHYLNCRFEDESEVVDWIRRNESQFLEVASNKKLFISPNSSMEMTFEEHLENYRQYISNFRDANFANALGKIPVGLLVFNAIQERLAPQFHLHENSDSFGAQPLVCLPEQSHYHELVANMRSEQLVSQRILKIETEQTLRSLNTSQFTWLGNVPIRDLADLRKKNANFDFRKRLAEFTSILDDASAADLDRVTGELSRGITSLVREHELEVKKIQEDFKLRHTRSAIALWATFAVQFVPVLAPFVSVALLPSSRYLYDKIEEGTAMRKARRSLTGVLAATFKSKGKTSR